MSETDKDMANVEAWAEVIQDMLSQIQVDSISVLRRAIEMEEAEIAESEKSGGPGLP